MVEFAADKTGFANCGVVTSEEGYRTFDLESRSGWETIFATNGIPATSLPSYAGLEGFAEALKDTPFGRLSR